MKPCSLSQRFVSCLSMALTAFCPLMHASANTLNSAIEFPAPSSSALQFLSAQLPNGLVYALIPIPQMEEHVLAKLAFQFSDLPDEQALSLLTLHALFQGTEKFDRQEIGTLLNQLGLDIDADSHIQIGEREQGIQFYSSSSQPLHLQQMLVLLEQLAFSPRLTDDGIELARQHLLSSLPEEMEEEGKQRTLKHQIASLTSSQVREFHSKWYLPSLTSLTLTAAQFDVKETIQQIEQLFGVESSTSQIDDPSIRLGQLANQTLLTALEQSIAIQSPSEKTPPEEFPGHPVFSQYIDFFSVENSYVVDGKIWMNPPSWIEQSSNGRLFGGLLTALGIGSFLIAIPLAPLLPAILPIGVIAGSLCSATGIYYLAGDYLKDPTYVESKRHEDLQRGFEHAYRRHRAGITLTPYERRYLFVQEMAHHPHLLTKPAIVLLADLYNLNNPLLAELFLIEERNYLEQIKLDFIQQRNQYKQIMDQLDRELALLVAPYAVDRDAKLAYAQSIYNQNYYVQQKRALKKSLDENLAVIEQAYQAKQMTSQEYDNAIAEQKKAYNDILHSAEFSGGLTEAENILFIMEQEALVTYDQQVELCKQAMQYDQRMAIFKAGKQSLILQYDAALRAGLANFPASLPSLPDFVDLRSR
ncbi:insulinase family protein [Candidatus Protochlamydia phocaeensis]|uniref:insulinase family protein n=1 Tax=Candidatus Protochlamydia phocaeensis TaxID=1414722 RepID=UPI000838653F|nr:insulinase family protein [Candidatus Protochlamydia phocaeensis]